MLVLLPPSEGKTAPPAGADPVDLDALVHARELGPARRKALGAKLRRAPAAPAHEVYTGVLFARMGLATLKHEDVLIFSALWGVVAPGDRIPEYKLPVGGSGRGPVLKPALAKALAARDVADEVVVDLRSGGYVALWKPTAASHVAVRLHAKRPDGARQVNSHNAKVARGDVGRAVLKSRRRVRTPEDVAAAARATGLEVELSGDGRAWTLDVLERA